MQLPTEVELTSGRPVIGKIILAYKKLVGVFVGPYMRHVIQKVEVDIDSLRDSLEQRLDFAEEKLDRAEDRIKGLLNATDALEVFSRDLVARSDTIARILKKRQDELGDSLEDHDSKHLDDVHKYKSVMNTIMTLRARLDELIRLKEAAKGDFTGADIFKDLSYLDFENRFRGDEKDIRKRQTVYLPVLAGQSLDGSVIDVGCGRGEFLELLKEKKIRAVGVDSSNEMVKICSDKGLDVVRSDAIKYLKSLGKSSGDIRAICAFHLIEHLTATDLIEFVKVCHRKLMHGGCLIMETPNPTCLRVFSGSFYVDPTHMKPLHPEFVRFMVEQIGFTVIDTFMLNASNEKLSMLTTTKDKEVKKVINSNFENLNSFLYNAPDYAVIARKE